MENSNKIKSSEIYKTQKEIANIVGVSRSTVSLALRDSAKVKQETKEKIKHLAKALNYYPSDIGRSLVTGRTNTVGVILPLFSINFYDEIADEIEKQLEEKGYSGIMLTGNTDEAIEKKVEIFIRKKVDGILFFDTIFSSRLKLNLTGRRIPFIVGNKTNENGDYVLSDKYKGGTMMMEHLIGLGYRKIAFLCWAVGTNPRFSAYKDALLKYNLPFKDEWVIPEVGFYESGYKGMKRLLELPDRPEAVFASNDMVAIGGMRAIKEAGLNIPQDIAIVGYDDIKEGRYSYIALTTVDQKKKELAQKSVEVLLRRIENKDYTENYRIVIEPELIIRESCGYHLKKKEEV